MQQLSARERFRLAGRHVLRTPAERAAHQLRIAAACALVGAEPLQGALADFWYGCAPAPALAGSVLAAPAVRGRLSPFVGAALLAQSHSGVRLARITTLATRWCLLVSPSLDVPSRAVLCGVDDSRAIAAAAAARIAAGGAGTETAETDFLAHCLGARDVLAFMLARRTLQRQGRVLDARWDQAMEQLQREVQS